MELSVSLDTICRLIVRAREMEARVPDAEVDDREDTTESDDAFAVMDDDADQVVEEEITGLLEELGEDQLAEVLALSWVGRGTYDASEWEDALEEANDPDGESPIDLLMDMPTLAANLDAGLTAFDLSCDGVGQLD